MAAPLSSLLRISSGGTGSSIFSISSDGKAVTVAASAASASTSSSSSTSTPFRTPTHVDSKRFAFDKVLDTTASQLDVYNDVRPLVDSVVHGYNSAVIAQGPVGAGATSTVLGGEADQGIIPRSLSSVFARAAESPDTAFDVRLTYVDVHGSGFTDLLAPRSAPSTSIDVHEARGRGVFLTGSDTLRTPVATLTDALNRVYAPGIAAKSPLAHRVCIIDVETAATATSAQRNGRLFVVDLAAPGNADSAEAHAANLSLVSLSNVLSAAASGAQERWLIPYRNSKLTYLLRDAIGGSGRTLVITACMSSPVSIRSTLTALTWASSAACAPATGGEGVSDAGTALKLASAEAEVVALRKECDALRSELDAVTGGSDDVGAGAGAGAGAGRGGKQSRRDVSAEASKGRQLRHMRERLEHAERLADPHLFQKLQDAVSEVEQQHERADELEARAIEAEDAILLVAEKAEAKYAKLKAQVAEYKDKMAAQAEAHKAALTAFEMEVTEAQEAAQRAEAQRREAELASLDARDGGHRLKDVMREARDALQRSEADVARLRKQNALLVEKFHELAGQVDSARSEHEAKYEKLAQESVNAAEEIAKVEKACEAKIARAEQRAEDRVARADKRVAEIEQRANIAKLQYDRDGEKAMDVAEKVASKMVAKAEAAAEKQLKALETAFGKERAKYEKEIKELKAATSTAAEAKRIAAAVKATMAKKRRAGGGAASSGSDTDATPGPEPAKRKRQPAKGKGAAAAAKAKAKAANATTGRGYGKGKGKAKAKAVDVGETSAITGTPGPVLGASDVSLDISLDESGWESASKKPRAEFASAPADGPAQPMADPTGGTANTSMASSTAASSAAGGGRSYAQPLAVATGKAGKVAAQKKRRLFTVSAVPMALKKPSMASDGAAAQAGGAAKVNASGLFSSFTDKPFRVPKLKAANKENGAGFGR